MADLRAAVPRNAEALPQRADDHALGLRERLRETLRLGQTGGRERIKPVRQAGREYVVVPPLGGVRPWYATERVQQASIALPIAGVEAYNPGASTWLKRASIQTRRDR